MEAGRTGGARAQGCLFLRWNWQVGGGALNDSTVAWEHGGAGRLGLGVQLGPAKQQVALVHR